MDYSYHYQLLFCTKGKASGNSASMTYMHTCTCVQAYFYYSLFISKYMKLVDLNFIDEYRQMISDIDNI